MGPPCHSTAREDSFHLTTKPMSVVGRGTPILLFPALRTGLFTLHPCGMYFVMRGFTSSALRTKLLTFYPFGMDSFAYLSSPRDVFWHAGLYFPRAAHEVTYLYPFGMDSFAHLSSLRDVFCHAGFYFLRAAHEVTYLLSLWDGFFCAPYSSPRDIFCHAGFYFLRAAHEVTYLLSLWDGFFCAP